MLHVRSDACNSTEKIATACCVVVYPYAVGAPEVTDCLELFALLFLVVLEVLAASGKGIRNGRGGQAG